ncbi:tryptophan aminotransferase-related protein 2-like isoform X1 [Primulina tabacum]|uniref:tryptophan aminotransferase-related protein 2-like isoform X1 n=2 Tax=Primulina tabacum TaxID=48773 RepID=UPI003F5A5F97
MEFKTMILGHLLMLSLALNVGLLYRDYGNGKQKFQEFFSSENKLKNASLITNRDANNVVENTVLETEETSSSKAVDETIDLDHGDPTMYERYWQKMGDKTTVLIPGWRFISYFSDGNNICWFLEPEFANAIIRLHKLVGNAVTENRYIVAGTGSTQLLQAVLYAVSPPNATEPIDVVSAAPFYSSYPLITDFLKSGLYKWGGDANKFKKDKPYIELVTSPNNPDGFSRDAVVNRDQGILIHDLAYYWPQYTSISYTADHDIMLFTVSKSTGHAGTRLGWALVKDQDIAKKMTEFVVLSTIGVSKESQIRAAKILQVVSDSHEYRGDFNEGEAFFEDSHKLVARRWKQLRDAVSIVKIFSLPEFPLWHCTFTNSSFTTQPAFAWLKCESEIDDCESFLRHHKIRTRGGKHFGGDEKYVRISVLPRDKIFDQFIKRLSSIGSS